MAATSLHITCPQYNAIQTLQTSAASGLFCSLGHFDTAAGTRSFTQLHQSLLPQLVPQSEFP